MEGRFNPLDPLGIFGRRSNPGPSTAGEHLAYLRSTVMGKLGRAITDEADAVRFYTDLANELSLKGEQQMTNKLMAIAQDEARHRITLEGIQQDIQRRPIPDAGARR